MRPSRQRSLGLVSAFASLALGAASCAGDGGTIEDTDAVTGATGTSTPDGYPEGPYGADVGEIVPNLSWMGFADVETGRPATASTYAAYSLDDARRSGKRWALLHFGAVF